MPLGITLESFSTTSGDVGAPASISLLTWGKTIELLAQYEAIFFPIIGEQKRSYIVVYNC